MSYLDDADPAQVEDRAFQQKIDQLQKAGKLSVQGMSAQARPASGWNLEAFQQLLTQRTAKVPEFPGAQASTDWLEMTKASLRQDEGSEAYAYHGLRSPHRANGVRVKDGHGSTDEVSVGYGWNMQRKDTRAVFKSELGLNDRDTDDVFNGRRPLETQQQEKLLTYAVLEANGGISRDLAGMAVRDHQRAALVSLAYNAGNGGLRSSGILDAIKAGRPDTEVAKMILGFKVGADGKLASRRKHEASLYLGAKAQAFFNTSK